MDEAMDVMVSAVLSAITTVMVIWMLDHRAELIRVHK